MSSASAAPSLPSGTLDEVRAKLADTLVVLAALEEPPARFAAGADAVEAFEAKGKLLLAQAHVFRDLSTSPAHDESQATMTLADAANVRVEDAFSSIKLALAAPGHAWSRALEIHRHERAS